MITGAARELTIVVSSPAIHIARCRNSARVLIACRDRDEPGGGSNPRWRSAIVARSVTELASIVRSPAVHIAAETNCAAVIPADGQGAEAQSSGNVARASAR